MAHIPFGYRKLAQFFNKRATKVADNTPQDKLDQEITKREKHAQRAVSFNKAAHVLGPVALLGTIIATGGAAAPVLIAVGAWGAAELGSASYTFKTAYEGQALEEKKKKPSPPAP